MMNVILRIVIPATIIFAVSEVSRRSPRLAALLLTLPLVSILAFAASWSKDHDLKSVSQIAKETLILSVQEPIIATPKKLARQIL
jgi:hypothetical protein